jgi:DNA-binding response OmpR family regulator
MSERIKILMVDDEEQFRATTQKILTKRGFETLLAASGEEAIEKLDENPDVVILDIRMPGMDGHQALKIIKKRFPDLPVIMLTGHGDEDSARRALEEGAFDYLAKPCDINVIAAKITEARRVQKHGAEVGSERSVREVMIPIEDYTTLAENDTVAEAVSELKTSFSSQVCTSRLMETGHRSLVVYDERGEVKGILAIIDLLRAVMPAYLSAPKPTMADSMQYSAMFWKGMFSREVRRLGKMPIADVMSPAPQRIDAGANLMEAAYLMVSSGERRLAVTEEERVVGIVREQDLFFEIERILRES